MRHFRRNLFFGILAASLTTIWLSLFGPHLPHTAIREIRKENKQFKAYEAA